MESAGPPSIALHVHTSTVYIKENNLINIINVLPVYKMLNNCYSFLHQANKNGSSVT
jgi:hypothetical protein